MRAVCLIPAVIVAAALPAAAQDLSAKAVLKAIDDGKALLVSKQDADGTWNSQYGKFGPTALCVLALLSAGESPDAPAVAKGLEYLRSLRDDQHSAAETYEVSLRLMALAAAKDPRDVPRIAALAARLEAGQVARGPAAGLWDYNLDKRGRFERDDGDRSNGQYAVLALREAASAGVAVDRTTWQRVRDHWVAAQNADGGWGYSPTRRTESFGSMTVAGISTLHIVKAMLRDGALGPDGTPDCCGRESDQALNDALDRGGHWLDKHFAADRNPGAGGVLYYLYGLERAGRLSGRRFFGGHDWYREGTAGLLLRQAGPGGWRGNGQGEFDPALGTGFALLFLSKGLAPVVVHKLKYRPPGQAGRDDGWDHHPDDARNLVEFVSTRPGWPKLLTWQVADLEKVAASGSVGDLMQAPVLYVTGPDGPPDLTDAEAALLRTYLDQGGFLFAVAGCDRARWDAGMRSLVARLYPNHEAELARLGADHPIYRAEFLFDDPDAIELWGVDIGCRTPLVYAPDDLGCLWEYWRPFDTPDRPPALETAVTQKLRVGVNVLAYATGREPPGKLDADLRPVESGRTGPVERGLLQIARLRHSGDWNTAPRALPNLLRALNDERVGVAASPRAGTLSAADPDLYKYPVVFMHGRTAFTLGAGEVERLREHLGRGAVLFADACCGAPAFDASFRALVKELYPDAEFKRIPAGHELFTTAVRADLSQVRRRVPQRGQGPLESEVVTGEPYLEGIEIDGRLAVIYSRYDISCALEKQSSAACAGYLPEDALKIAINVVLYAMLQDVSAGEDSRRSRGGG